MPIPHPLYSHSRLIQAVHKFFVFFVFQDIYTLDRTAWHQRQNANTRGIYRGASIMMVEEENPCLTVSKQEQRR